MTITQNDTQKINRYVVTQHNNLVEANYSGNLSSRALKVSRLLISSLSPDTKKLERIEVDISALKRFLGYTDSVTWGRFHDDLKDMAKQLNKEPFEIPLGKGKMLVSFFISSYTIDIPQGKIVFNLSPELAPYLLQLKQDYTSYLLINTRKIRSVYSFRLYELLRQYKKIGKRYFELDDLQKKVGSSYYNKYNNFKRKVIIQAQQDLKKHTDIAFAFDEKKEGRKVVGLEFIIFGNKPEQQDPNQLSFLENAVQISSPSDKAALSGSIIIAMNELGISEQNISKYLSIGFDIVSDKEKRKGVIKRCETLQNYYLEKLELTKQSADSANAAGYFIKALKEDWLNSKTLKKVKNEAAARERTKAAKTLQTLTVKIEELSKKREAVRTSIITNLLANDTDLETAYHAAMESIGDYIKKFISDVLHLPIREQYEQSIHVSSRVSVYLSKTYPEHFKEATAIDKQIEQVQREIQKIRKNHPYLQ